VRQALREGIQEVRLSLPFTIEAWVLLPDHMHTIWTLPDGDANYQARWAIIKRTVTRRCTGLLAKGKEDLVRKTHPTFVGNELNTSIQSRREGGLWQRRFWEHAIRDEEDFRRHMDYLHYNSVKHGYVKNVVDWPYSTFHRLVARGKYTPNWGWNSFDDMKAKDFGE
jgi:putative transposase